MGRLDKAEVDMVAEAAYMAVDTLDAQGDWDLVVGFCPVDFQDNLEVAV